MAKQKPLPIEAFLPSGEEAILTKNHFKIETRRLVNVDEVDWELSAKNQARIKTPLSQEHVDDIALALMEDPPAVLPDLILCDFGGKKLLIWSGNHRGGGYKEAGITQFWAVIVKCTDESLLDIMPRLFNRTSGLKLDRAEALLQVSYVVEKYKWPYNKAAKAFGVSESVVNTHMRAEKIRMELEQLGIKTGDLKPSHLNAISPISGNEHVLEQVGRLVASCKLTSTQIGAIVQEIKGGKTESAQLEIAKKLAKEYIGNNPKSGLKRSKYSQLRSLTSSLFNLLRDADNVKQLEVTEKEQIEAAENRLKEVAAECLRVAEGKKRRRKPSA